MNVAILGAGGIAQKMARTLKGMIAQGNEGVAMHSVASRDGEKALSFAREYGFEKAYGSYEEMLRDPDVDLVYVATPHSHHYEQMMMCLKHGKHILCEKAFTINARQAEEVLALAREKGLYVAEAIWTRYLPSRKMIDDLIAGGAIGKPRMVMANLAYVLDHVERMIRPELAGGALLDLGVYALNFAAMVLGKDVIDIQAVAQMHETGVDMQDSITLTFAGGEMAVLCAAMNCAGDSRGVVYGTKGTLTADNINNPGVITVVPYLKAEETRTYPVPKQITGFEYQVQAAVDAIERGQVECEAIPHDETIRIMKLMDDTRHLGLPVPKRINGQTKPPDPVDPAFF
ncbi:MAG TPA: Gfo/Idh/MocA family oxidoreductase [Candidatus Limiplasma sp.]|nr:Gfo/Idh/MocA family oxidoreductase [Candidatus Limiplasma sp.]